MKGAQVEYSSRGDVEVDCCRVRGSNKQTNYKANRIDQRLAR